MTVKELIEKLSSMPQDGRVIINMGKNELANGRECGLVECVPAVLDYGIDQWIPSEYFDGIQEPALREYVVSIESTFIK